MPSSKVGWHGTSISLDLCRILDFDGVFVYNRESTVVEKLVNRRFAVLNSSVFATFRKETDDAPSKVWSVTKDVVLTEITSGLFHVKNPGASALWAVASGAYEKKTMWAFTVTWSVVLSSDTLTLAFDTEDVAKTWHDAFTKCIQVSSPGEESGRIQGEDGRMSKDVSGMLPEILPSFEGNEHVTKRSWASLLHINGISVYVEELDEDGGGGALMVSAVVRAPPSDVTSHLVRVRKREGLAIFAGARTLKVVDDNTHIIGQTWTGSGILGRCTAPREIVLLRTWRKDPDGTYIVLYQSTNHVSMRKQKGKWWSLSTPVRVDVEAAGFTIAPLLPKYAPRAGESQESLVTLVLKADLGGMLSGGSAAGRLLSPFQGIAVKSMLEPVVTSLVVLRDQVEQNRFVIRPLSHVLDTEPEIADTKMERRSIARTATMLVYRDRETLAEAQMNVKEETQMKTPEEKEMTDTSWAIAGSCDHKYWLSPGCSNFKVRGKNYLVDKKKISAALPMFELVAVDLLEMEEPIYHVCQHLPSVQHSPAPFLFCVQMMVPSSPPVSLVCSWAAPLDMMDSDPVDLITKYESENGPCDENVKAFFRCFTEFISGDGPEADNKRNEKFKLIPGIARGSWIIKQSVGTTPVILGKKLATKYYRGSKYFEVDVDIGANSVAASITNLVCGATKSLAVDMGVLIEGQSDDTLPEQLIGTVRLDALDLKTASYFDESSGTVVRKDAFK